MRTWYVDTARTRVVWATAVVAGKATLDIFELVDHDDTANETLRLWRRNGQAVSEHDRLQAIGRESADAVPAAYLPTATPPRRRRGTASVANGGTIPHGLSRAPGAWSVSPTVAGRIAVVTAASATTLAVSLLNHDGVAVTVAENVNWSAEL